MNLHFRTFRLQPPHAPPSSGNTFCSGRAWPPFRIGLLTVVLRTSHIPSSLVSRIRPNRVCVATPFLGHCSTDYPFTSSCSPPRVATAQLLSVTGGKLRQRGTLTLLCSLTLKRTSPPIYRWETGGGKTESRQGTTENCFAHPNRSAPSLPFSEDHV